MSKQVITVDGQERVVREDTAKSYRGVYWALASILAFIIIAAILFFGGLLTTSREGDIKSPATLERDTGR